MLSLGLLPSILHPPCFIPFRSRWEMKMKTDEERETRWRPTTSTSNPNKIPQSSVRATVLQWPHPGHQQRDNMVVGQHDRMVLADVAAAWQQQHQHWRPARIFIPKEFLFVDFVSRSLFYSFQLLVLLLVLLCLFLLLFSGRSICSECPLLSYMLMFEYLYTKFCI